MIIGRCNNYQTKCTIARVSQNMNKICKNVTKPTSKYPNRHGTELESLKIIFVDNSSPSSQKTAFITEYSHAA